MTPKKVKIIFFLFLAFCFLAIPLGLPSAWANPLRGTLPNGLNIFIFENPGTTSISVDLWVRTGSRYETPGKNGISHFVEHLLFKGTSKRTAQDISRQIAAVGGLINAFTHWEYTHFQISILPQNLDLALDILADIAQNSLMSAEMVSKERKVVLEEISLAKIYPPSYVLNLVSRTLFPENPLDMPISGTRQTVQDIERPDLIQFYHHFYVPNNAFLTIVGNVHSPTAYATVGEKFQTWPRGERILSPPFPPYRQSVFKEVRERKLLDQAIIVIALQAMGSKDVDRPAFEIINAVLGSGGHSRLYQEVREKRGLAYLVGSLYHPLTDTGLWATYAGTNPQSLQEVQTIFFQQIKKIREEPIPAAELREIKNYIRGRTLIRNENNTSLSDFIGQSLLGGSWELPEEYLAKVEAVTAHDVLRVAQVYLREDQCNLIILKPYPGLTLFRDLF
jgi:predicted Zn-dependent peptidase